MYFTKKVFEEATFGDVEDISFRKSLVNTYIRGVIYYPDKIIVTMNFTDTCDPPQMTPESIKEIEKQSASETAFQKNMSSYTLSSSPKKKLYSPNGELYWASPGSICSASDIACEQL